MSSRTVRCAHCKSAVIATARQSGAAHPGERVQVLMDPESRNVVLLVCPACNGVSIWRNKRIIIVDV